VSDKNAKSSSLGRALKLFGLIFLVLLVPLVMDQADVDHETVRTVGRVAAGLTGLLFCYGIFTKLLKVLAFVVLALIASVVMVSEGKVKAPRVREFFAERADARSK